MNICRVAVVAVVVVVVGAVVICHPFIRPSGVRMSPIDPLHLLVSLPDAFSGFSLCFFSAAFGCEGYFRYCHRPSFVLFRIFSGSFQDLFRILEGFLSGSRFFPDIFDYGYELGFFQGSLQGSFRIFSGAFQDVPGILAVFL